MDAEAWLAIFAIVEQNHGVKEKLRPGGMSIEKQQDMKVLGVDLSPSVSFKARCVVRPYVMLNACLALSWPDPMIRPRSRVVQFRLSPDKWKCAH